MALIADDDFCLLAEEKFDFDVSLSPASSKGDEEDEDEVFLGPVGHKEKCISHGMETQVQDSVSSGPSLGEEPSWSPLLEENFEAIRKEAHLLASHIERGITDPVADVVTASSSLPQDTEKFEADASAKLEMLSVPASVLSPIKRETFCVQDSPMKQLPPAIQKRLQKVCSMPTGKPRLSTSSPMRTTETQPKIPQRGQSLVGSCSALPNRPTAKGNSRLSSCNRPALQCKSRLQPPSKGSFGLKRSPGGNTNTAGSTEDLLSDTNSIASDVSDSSFNTSLSRKKGLPVLAKPEQRNTSARKVPPPTNRRAVDRSRNTSSSSSSVSSINSSLSVSPTSKGKLNSSLNTSLSNISSRVPSSNSRLPNSARKSSIILRPHEASVGRQMSLSKLGRKSSEPLPRPVKATPIKRAEPLSSTQHQTSAQKTMERTSSVPIIPMVVKTGSAVKVNPIPKAFVAPTPTNSQKWVCRPKGTSSPDVPRIMKPKRLMTSCSVESAPQRLAVPAPQAPLTPSAAAGNPMLTKLRRPSALPTPVRRRVSAIPMLTPKSVPRLSRSPNSTELQSPSSCSGMSHSSPGQLKPNEQLEVSEQAVSTEQSCASAEFQPCSLVFNLEDGGETSADYEPAVVEKPTNLSPKSSEPLQPKPDSPAFLQSDATLHNHQLNKSVAQEVSEVLLVDAPAPVLKEEEKILIDLSNTPDIIKSIPNKAFGGQLIDLSSPLIKWSPEEKKENKVNETVLINLSF